MAADNHDRAARYWEGRQDQQRAELQREMAKYERQGAELERRWADLVDPDPARRETRAAEQVMRDTRQGAKHASTILTRLATTLDTSASIAEHHAVRREQAGRSEDAAQERQSAKRARTAARRARSQAEQWLKVAQEQDA
jgi:hypothetical protein